MVLPIHIKDGVDFMGKVKFRFKEYLVIDEGPKKGHVVINTKGKHENHGHIHSLGTCKKFIKLMDKKTIPNSPYLRESVLRISLDEKYKSDVQRKILKDKDKQKFFRPPKGVMKR